MSTMSRSNMNIKYFAIVLLCALEFVHSIEVRHEGNTRESRKLFGGYKITPRYCKPTRRAETGEQELNGPTICMFNHECAQRNGMVVGACMDGFLFGACCQLPDEQSVGDFISTVDEGEIPVKSQDNSVYAVPFTRQDSTTSSSLHNTMSNDHQITLSGVSQIANTLLNQPSILPTAQDDTMVQFGDKETDQFISGSGVTHPSAPSDTDVVSNTSPAGINEKDFTFTPAEERKTTVEIMDETTKPYKTDAPVIQISISTSKPHSTNNKKPIFRPKPSMKPNDNDKYVLVQTLSNGNQNNNKNNTEFDAIVNIIQMLNETSTSKYGHQSTKRPPPSTSYVFSLTPTRRPGYDPTTTKRHSQGSNTYVYGTTTPVSTTTKKKGSVTKIKVKPTTFSESATRPTYSYVYSSTFRPSTKPNPTKSTYANSPSAFPNSTKKPPSTSYVYSSTVTKRPVIHTHSTYSSYSPSSTAGTTSGGIEASPPPTVIVLGPFNSESSTPQPQVQHQSQPTQSPSRKPVTQITINNHITQNIYSSTERPTVLITPKTPKTPQAQVEGQNPNHQVLVHNAPPTSSDDLINFPPDRNPNLNISASVLEEDDSITTPAFIEDEILDKKVASFVNKIVQSLQEPFQGLRDVVYNRNKTHQVFHDGAPTPSTPSPPTTHKKPTKNKIATSTTKKPSASGQRPSSANNKPAKPVSQKPTSTKKPVVVKRTTTPPTATRRTTTTVATKRTKPTARRTTTTTASYIEEEEEDEEEDTSGDFRNQCGVRPMLKSGRIVGGKGATFGAFPWQVLVRESTWLGLFTKNKCGGVLISNRYVITAAHCQPGFLASLVAVLGEFDISGELESKRSISRNVKRVIVHRQYDPATFENDLALLELEHPVQFDSHIVPICLPRDGEDFTGQYATVTGWGRLKYGGGVPSVLQEVQVPIMENNVCQEMFRTAGHSKVILESFLCAGYANGQKDSCEGDSGGPLVLKRPDGRYQLAGTVSHGIKCAAPYLPGVYMRTTYYKPWIESITGIH